MKYLEIPIASTISMAILLLASSPSNAQALTFNEIDDAGESLGTAQVVPFHSSLPNFISGRLSGFDDPADLFQIFLSGGKTFSASTVGGADFDTRLFLFDADGFGVYFNDDASISTLQSTLPANNLFTPTQSGIYYLGISSLDYAPVNTAGEWIFPRLVDFPIDIPLDDIFTGVFGPTESGKNAPLAGFDGSILDDGGDYTITLSEVASVPTSVPEPTSILGFLIVGISGLTLRFRNQENRTSLSN